MDHLLANHNIVCTIDLNRCEVEPYNWLFQQLKNWDHATFDPEQRILLTYIGSISIDLLSHVQRVVNFLDITNFFILIATDDSSIEQKIQLVTDTVSTDPTKFSFDLRELNYPVVQGVKTKFTLPEKLCLAPWAKIEITETGGAMPCCVYAKNITDESGNLLQVTNNSIEKIYFSKELTDLRQEFLSGGTPKNCDNCWTSEHTGSASIRQIINWDLRSQLYNIDFYNESLSNVKSMHSILGNICNLKCRVCSPKLSSKHAVESLSQLPKSQRRQSVLYSQLKQKSWVNDSSLEYWDQYKKIAKNLTEISFTGGEPLMIKKQFELVKDIAQEDYSKNITLKYTSNGTVFPVDAIEHWAQFKSVEIGLSIDDMGPRFEYQRSGAIWSEVVNNIYQFKQLRSKINLVLKINVTASVFNAWYLPDLCNEIEQLGVDFIRIKMLQYPDELSIRHLPKDVKEKLFDRLSNATYSQKIQKQITGIINYLNLESTDLRQQLVERIRKFDQIRNENFAETFPEMADLLNYQK